MIGTATTTSDRRTPRRRYLTFLAVLAFHTALIIVLAMSSKTLRLSIPAKSPLELLFLSPTTASIARPERLVPMPPRPEVKNVIGAPPSVNAPLSVAPIESKKPAIDWANEAQQVAAATEPSSGVRSFDHRSGSGSSHPPSKPIFDEPPAHHAGEEFKTDDGRRAVFVSDNCYQLSNPFASPNALENGMGVQTYCIGKSNQPRGDLFEQLSAYKRLHPSQ